MRKRSVMFVMMLFAVSLSFAQNTGGAQNQKPAKGSGAKGSEIVVTKPSNAAVQKVREANSKKGHKGGKKGHQSKSGKISLGD